MPGTRASGEPTTLVFLNRQVVKLPSQYLCLCPYLSVVLNLSKRGFLLQWAKVNASWGQATVESYVFTEIRERGKRKDGKSVRAGGGDAAKGVFRTWRASVILTHKLTAGGYLPKSKTGDTAAWLGRGSWGPTLSEKIVVWGGVFYFRGYGCISRHTQAELTELRGVLKMERQGKKGVWNLERGKGS